MEKWIQKIGLRRPPPVAVPLAETRRFLICLHRDLIGRSPTAGEIAYALERLQTGVSRADVVLELLNGAECRAWRVIALFRRCLGRLPREEEKTFWTGVLAAGKSDEDVASALLGSGEIAKLEPEEFVRCVFERLVRRAPTKHERSPWAARLAERFATTMTVACHVARCDEARAIPITEAYRRFLNREVSPAEREDSLARLRAGATHERVVAELLAGEEYAYHAGFRPTAVA